MGVLSKQREIKYTKSPFWFRLREWRCWRPIRRRVEIPCVQSAKDPARSSQCRNSEFPKPEPHALFGQTPAPSELEGAPLPAACSIAELSQLWHADSQAGGFGSCSVQRLKAQHSLTPGKRIHSSYPLTFYTRKTAHRNPSSIRHHHHDSMILRWVLVPCPTLGTRGPGYQGYRVPEPGRTGCSSV